MTSNRQRRMERAEKMRKEHDEFMGYNDPLSHRNPNNDWFFEKVDANFERAADRVFKWAPTLAIASIVATLALSVAFVWAIVTVVLHFT